jgi:hypothetical protein
MERGRSRRGKSEGAESEGVNQHKKLKSRVYILNF